MMKISRYLPLVLLFLQPIFVSAEEGATCDEFTTLSVADFDGNGIVNRRDMAMLAKIIRKNERIEKRNLRIEKYNSRRSKHHRGEVRSNSRRLKEPQQIVYSPLLDRNNDGEIDDIDMFKATRTMGEESTPADQELVTNYNEFLAGNYVCAETVEVEATIPAVEEPVVEEPVIEEPVIEEPVDTNY